MIIERILNNNAVMSRSRLGEEIIVKGKGIAFGKKPGDPIDDHLVGKIFLPQNQDINRRYQQILVSIPYDCVEGSEKIIDAIRSMVSKKLSDKIYVTLTDHIDSLIDRLRQGIELDNTMLWDVRRMYPEEYQAGKKAVQMIREIFDLRVPDDEAGFIALHIMNAEINAEIKDTYKITAMIDDIYEIVESDFDLNTDKESLDYTRFIMHLRIFFERIINKKCYQQEKSRQLLDNLKESYPRQYQCVLKIIGYVKQRYDEPMEGEILYLLVYIVKLTEHQNLKGGEFD